MWQCGDEDLRQHHKDTNYGSYIQPVHPVYSILPRRRIISEPAIYVAYHFYGAGHYDATDPTYGKLHLHFF